MRRSLFGLAHCYNKLPQKTVEARTVRAFQRNLQAALKNYSLVQGGDEDWQRLPSTGWKDLPRTQLDSLFT